MKLKHFVVLVLILPIFYSCIKDEAPNMEADILEFSLSDGIVWDVVGIENKSSNISLLLKKTVDEITPEIRITPGATITPASGTTVSIKDSVVYTIVSEDGQYRRSIVVKASLFELDYDFENWTTDNSPYPHPAMSDNMWTTANAGIAMAKTGNVDVYPTRLTEDAYKGKYAALLQTQKGGTYWFNLIPVFSGSLFRGVFKINMANFVKSAKFGQLHPEELGRPTEFKGFYKYKPGDVFYNEKDKVVPGRIDECSIYAVLYKVDKVNGKEEYLDGTNVMTSDKVIAKADFPDRSEKASYTEFKVPFVYTEEPDYEKYNYKLAVVFASSREGDFYRGAVGSTLIVDEVNVICDPYEKKNK